MSQKYDKGKTAGLKAIMLGRQKKSVKNSGGALPHRPHSETDFNELEEQFSLDHLSEGEIESKFEKMLDDMNLSEEKKMPLRQQSTGRKKEMLTMHFKGSIPRSNKHHLDTPAEYIDALNFEMSTQKLYNTIESLRIALTNNTLKWVEEFGNMGLQRVLMTLNECYRRDRQQYHKIQYECIRCLSAIMNNTVGIKQMLDHKEAFTILSRSLDPALPGVMHEVIRIFSALCIINQHGHEKTLEAITISADINQREMRFQPIVDGLLTKDHDQLKVSCMTLINAIVNAPDDLDFRLHLRNEFMRTGLGDALEKIENDLNADLQTQLNVYNDTRERDGDDFQARFDNFRLDFEDMNDCYELIKNCVNDTSAEHYFLSILQHLLCIRDDAFARPAYYRLIEECVSQIVLHKSGCDPDFRSSRRFNIDVEPLIDHIVEEEKKKEEDKQNFSDLSKKLDEALTEKQEAQARISQLEKRISDFEQGIVKSGGVVSQIANSGLILPPAPPGSIPPPPPIPGGPPPPPMPGMKGPPPPPMMPGMGGPPPPPMPGGMGGPPPPPMMRTPGGPPPPPMGFTPTPPKMDVLPFGMKPKKKWDLSAPMKKVNWKVVAPQKMTEKAFWVQVREDKLESTELLTGLTLKFSSRPPAKVNREGDPERVQSKRIKELKVLDSKSAQNISILLGGCLKHLSYDKIRDCILCCDDEVLTDSILEQLLLQLPSADILKKLEEFEDQYNDLAEAEQFALRLGSVKRLHPRLKSLSFRQNYKELIQDIKPDIVCGTAACEEIKSSKKFSKVLELVLLMGNYMNSGSKNGQAVGFDINYLTKLSGTKDSENKTTLLHYLADIVERLYPDLLGFDSELIHCEKAARVSLETIQKLLRHMDSAIRNLETDLKNSRVKQSELDRFEEVMSPFAKQAREQCDLLQSMYKKMDSLYDCIAEYYVFDRQKYTFEEFYGDVKTFMLEFAQAYKDNVKLREAEEKLRRSQEAREKAEKEKAERVQRKRALVDMKTDINQEGVMDSLLEALKNGSAFAREQKRKRPPRTGGAAERRAQLNRTRSRSGLMALSPSDREIISMEIDNVENIPITNLRRNDHLHNREVIYGNTEELNNILRNHER